MWKIIKLIQKGDYLYALVPNHPRATKNGYVLHHRIVVENLIGRLLTEHEIVHHKNHNKKDNSPANLVLMLGSEHNRQHALERGRLMATLCCPWCQISFVRECRRTFLIKGSEYTCCSPSCRGSFSRDLQLYGYTKDNKLRIKNNLIRTFRQFTENNA